jgi:hypothetical protein
MHVIAMSNRWGWLGRASQIGLAVFGVAVAVSSCKRSEGTQGDAGTAASADSQRVGSCDRVSATGTCSEYKGAYLTQNELLLTSSCGKLGGTFVYAECPNTSGVGACTFTTGEVRKFYGTGASAWEPDRAQKECERSFHGVWKARF